MVTKCRKTTREAGERLPRKLEPVNCDRWVLVVPGIDSFLVSSFEMPRIGRGTQSTMTVRLYNVCDWDPTPDYLEWMRSGNWREAKLKFIDPVGKVTSQWTFMVSVKTVSFDRLGYDSTAPWCTELELDWRDLSIKEVEKKCT
jgi:hypothetical protein